MAQKLESVTDLVPCRRYIASHDSSGKSIYLESSPQQYLGALEVGGFARSYSVASVPAKLEGDGDLKAYLSEEGNTSWTSPNIVTPGGVNFLVVDLAPGKSSAMHRTVSIDFSVCVIGDIIHELDSGETVRLKPGVRILIRRSTQVLIVIPGSHHPAWDDASMDQRIQDGTSSFCRHHHCL
jgi:hypothetical protein